MTTRASVFSARPVAERTFSTANKLKSFHEEDTDLRKVITEFVKVFVFYCVGVVFYKFTEGWPPLTSIYFTTVSILTIGYGDLGPTSDSGRLFTMVYVFVGLAVIFQIIAGLGEHCVTAAEDYLLDPLENHLRSMDRVAKNLDHAAKQLRKKHSLDSLETFRPSSEEEDLTEIERVASQTRRHWAKILFTGIILLIPLLVGSVILWALNDGQGHLDYDSLSVKRWRYMDALWYSFCTLTTIGYGDISYRATFPTRAFLCVFMPCAVVFGAAAIGNVASMFKEIREEQRQFQLLDNMDFQMISEMDRNGDGVDKTEYVLAMIKAMNLVDEQKIARFETQFDEADVDSSGKLDSDDLLAIARERERVKDRHLGFHEARKHVLMRGKNRSSLRSTRTSIFASQNWGRSQPAQGGDELQLSYADVEAPADASPSHRAASLEPAHSRGGGVATEMDVAAAMDVPPPPEPLQASRRTSLSALPSAPRGDLLQVADALAGLACEIRPDECGRADGIRDDIRRGELARATLALRELAAAIAQAQGRSAVACC